MTIFVETPRLILRELLPGDDKAMFEMDSDPEVHRYLGNNPSTDIEQIRSVINSVRQQYLDNGIGRWAMIDKVTNEFIGWTGLKLVKEPTVDKAEYYDLGYRLLRKYWGKGYATESAIASVNYGFEIMKLAEINGRADTGNTASKSVLKKSGLNFVDNRYFDGKEHAWFSLLNNEWEAKKAL